MDFDGERASQYYNCLPVFTFVPILFEDLEIGYAMGSGLSCTNVKLIECYWITD